MLLRVKGPLAGHLPGVRTVPFFAHLPIGQHDMRPAVTQERWTARCHEPAVDCSSTWVALTAAQPYRGRRCRPVPRRVNSAVALHHVDRPPAVEVDQLGGEDGAVWRSTRRNDVSSTPR